MSTDIETKSEIYTDLADLAKHEDIADHMSHGRRVYRVPTPGKTYYAIASARQTAINAVARHLVAITTGQLDAEVVNTSDLFKALREAVTTESLD